MDRNLEDYKIAWLVGSETSEVAITRTAKYKSVRQYNRFHEYNNNI